MVRTRKERRHKWPVTLSRSEAQNPLEGPTADHRRSLHQHEVPPPGMVRGDPEAEGHPHALPTRSYPTGDPPGCLEDPLAPRSLSVVGCYSVGPSLCPLCGRGAVPPATDEILRAIRPGGGPAPLMRLVAFTPPFDRWNSVIERIRWGENPAK